MPREEVLRDYYKRYYTATDSTATFDGSDRFSRHLFRTLGVAPKSNIRILDFGGGMDAVISRSLARRFLERGTRNVEIALVDYNASCAREWGDRAIECYQSLPEATGGGFDVVVASAIVEHIPYPRDAILELLNALSMGGRAYFRTPAMSSLIKAAALFGVTIDFTFPGHVHDMGQPFWENLLAALGVSSTFRLIRSRPAIVETELLAYPSRTLIAHALKWPWYVLRRGYSMVGGWEAVFARV
jgi:2-polyprenyl-3-methyl-5-hydroxy-6-metoxy-1,4-benzoquinol methylase